MFTMVDLCGTKQTLSFSKQNALTFSNSYWMQHLLWFSTNLLLQQEQIFKKKKKKKHLNGNFLEKCFPKPKT